MKKIFSLPIHEHDHTSFDGDLHDIGERTTRQKAMKSYNANGMMRYLQSRNFADQWILNHKKEFIDADVFAISCVDVSRNWPMYPNLLEPNILKNNRPDHLWHHIIEGKTYYVDHHISHAAYAFLNSGFDEADILAMDASGSQFHTMFVDKDQKVIDLNEGYALGKLWDIASDSMPGAPSAGKIMGLSAYGNPDSFLYAHFSLIVSRSGWSDAGSTLHKPYSELVEETISYGFEPEVIAATVQDLTNDVIKKIVKNFKTSNKICVAGGSAYNGYMNEILTKYYDEVYVPPAPGDEGQSLGCYMHADYVLNGRINKLTAYHGKQYEFDESMAKDLYYRKMNYEDIYPLIAEEISKGAIVGWFQGRSESGNRALGNRSIVADPRNPDIKNIINSTIKMREDYRPFAPSVLEEHYKEWFDTKHPSPFMSRIMPVHKDKQSIVPGIVHVDGTARIQTVTEEQNEHWYKLISAFNDVTGVPMVVNTSFNCQEPIVETPEHAIDTFKRTALTHLVINDYVITKEKP